jgi:hypothetical protein
MVGLCDQDVLDDGKDRIQHAIYVFVSRGAQNQDHLSVWEHLFDECAQFVHRVSIVRTIYDHPWMPAENFQPAWPLCGLEPGKDGCVRNVQSCLTGRMTVYLGFCLAQLRDSGQCRGGICLLVAPKKCQMIGGSRAQ